MSLAKQKESLIRDRDRLTAEVDDLNKRLQQQRIQNDALEKKRAEFEEKCRELYRMLDVSEYKLLNEAMKNFSILSIVGNINRSIQGKTRI